MRNILLCCVISICLSHVAYAGPGTRKYCPDPNDIYFLPPNTMTTCQIGFWYALSTTTTPHQYFTEGFYGWNLPIFIELPSEIAAACASPGLKILFLSEAVADVNGPTEYVACQYGIVDPNDLPSDNIVYTFLLDNYPL